MAALRAAFAARHGGGGAAGGTGGILRSISRAAPSSPTVPVYDFTTVSTIFDVDLPAEGDITAVVTGVGAQTVHVTAAGTEVAKKTITLEDSSGSVKLTLWREAASLDFALNAIVAVSCAKVVRDGLWGTSKTTFEFNPPSAPADLLEWNAVRVAPPALAAEAPAHPAASE